VVEVPTLMTSRERRGQLGRGKTDPVDALAIARIIAREPQLPPVRLTVGLPTDLRALLDYREDLVTERGAWSTGPMPSSAACAPAITTTSPT
jgi:transposase